MPIGSRSPLPVSAGRLSGVIRGVKYSRFPRNSVSYKLNSRCQRELSPETTLPVSRHHFAAARKKRLSPRGALSPGGPQTEDIFLFVFSSLIPPSRGWKSRNGVSGVAGLRNEQIGFIPLSREIFPLYLSKILQMVPSKNRSSITYGSH